MKHKLSKISAIFIICWIISIFCFILDAIDCKSEINTTHNNVVVLTGGKNRISKALKLICSKHKPKNIFISGVYAKTRLIDILPNNNSDGVDVFLGKDSKNTKENAEEVCRWMKRHNVNEMLLITSDYHMRRSICELKKNDSNLIINSCAVKSNMNFDFLKNCFMEFHKWIYCYCRM